MAGDKVNNYSQVDSNILELQLTTDKTFKGYHHLTLTEYDTTTVPAIAAGSAIECNGALYKFDSEEAISTTDPVTSSAVADGTVYVCIVPGATTCTAAFTATAPTWSDSKQGWYGTGGQANYRYAEFIITKATSAFSKNVMDSKINLKKSFVTISGGTGAIGSSPAVLSLTSSVDVLSEFNNSTYRFYPKHPGYYAISGALISTAAATTSATLYARINGSTNGTRIGYVKANTYAIFTISGVKYLTINDYMDFILYHDGTGNFTAETEINIYKVQN